MLSDDQIDRITAARRTFLFGGLMLVVTACALPRGWGIGVISGFMLFSLGIYGASLSKWRFEPGLWMLAALLAVTLGSCWAYFEILSFQSIFLKAARNQPAKGVTREQIMFSVDSTIALVILSQAVRLAASVAVKNWQRIRRRKDDLRA
ncbi:MAG TPA: hypothetical protein VMV69_15825 [Pirellulales bacterium]|nr:hypothetical protein [Pirellulales bacterium]